MIKKFYIVILIFIVGLSLNGYSQKFRHRKEKHSAAYSRKSESIFPTSFNYEPKGWFWDIGVTFPLTRIGIKTVNFSDSLTANFKDKGSLRFLLGVGRYRMLDNWYLFKYFDYGIDYKWLAGKELFETNTNPILKGKSTFNDHHISIFANFNNITDITNAFIQNSIGVNIDYQFLQNRKSEFGINEKYPSNFIAQLHYKIGYGFKPNDKLLVISTVEIPIVGFVPNIPNPMLSYFNSNFLPMLLSVRLLILRPKETICPPVYAPELPEGFQPDGSE